MEDSIVIQASVSNLSKVMLWISRQLDCYKIDEKKKKHIELALEEAIVNIMFHAYAPNQGMLKVHVAFDKGHKELKFEIQDQGKPFNPLQFQDPNIKQHLDDRKVGGLGIYFMKKVSDHIFYERVKDTNVLTIKNEI